MKLEQGQIWKREGDYLRIVEWARMSIVYKTMTDPAAKTGETHAVTKKEFCRLVKTAQLMTPADLQLMQTPAPGTV